jgi:hypothetical protein
MSKRKSKNSESCIDLTTEFYETIVKDKYSGVDIDILKLVILGPWSYLRKIISSGKFYDVRFEGLGIFEVSSYRVQHVIERLKERCTKGLVSKLLVDSYSKSYEKYFKRRKKYEEFYNK